MSAKKKIRKKKTGPVFSDSVTGTYGSFVTPAGEVSYLMTKATLRFSGTPRDGEEASSKLTRVLAPAREALDVSNLGFDELLQRDLDDNRIVYELIPYLLGSKRSGIPLFPPIVVMVLPFQKGKVSSAYSNVKKEKVQHAEYEGDWERSTFDESFEIDRALDDSVTPNFAILKWHYEESKLVVLDGQHRAMALLGLHRIMNNDWPSDASKFKVFYKDAVGALLKKAGAQVPEIIELPVMLTWLPNKDISLTEVVRKLFVDINSNARRPSPSRLLLLSDDKLSNFLTRRLLTEIRAKDSDIPLSSVEYDYPHSGRSSSQKWSCFTNVEILRDLIHWNVFKARTLADKMDADVIKKGKMSGSDIHISLREEIRAKSLGKKFEEGEEEMDPKEITNDHFPRFNKEKLEKLLGNFSELHAKPLIALFSTTAPYKAHFTALEDFEGTFEDTYGTQSVSPELCREALFEGQGAYWTIKTGADGSGGNTSNELARCWKALCGSMKNDFEARRMLAYVGKKPSPKQATEFAKFFETLRTSAAQGGLALILCSLQRVAGVTDADKRLKLAKAIGNGISTGLKKGNGRNLLFLCPNGKGSLNRIPKLQPKFAGYWRYLWLEVLVIGAGESGLAKVGVSKKIVSELLLDGRAFYFRDLIKLRRKQLYQSDRSKEVEEFQVEATRLVQDEIVAALQKGCGVLKSAATKLWDKALSHTPKSSTESENGNDEDPEEAFQI